jgi:ABC-type phosphate/phosphonate transport system permease subunit
VGGGIGMIIMEILKGFDFENTMCVLIFLWQIIVMYQNGVESNGLGVSSGASGTTGGEDDDKERRKRKKQEDDRWVAIYLLSVLWVFFVGLDLYIQRDLLFSIYTLICRRIFGKKGE